jgi:hypothetical protein
MRMMTWRGTLLAGAVIGLACSSPTDMCSCPPVDLSAVIAGRVQTEAGAPVPQATVTAYIARGDDCGRRESDDGLAQTASDGTYKLFLLGIGETEATCVRVRVRAPLESGLADAADTTVTLAIRSVEPFDSTRVDAILGAP